MECRSASANHALKTLEMVKPLTDVFQNRCSLKFRNFHRRTLVVESLFNKITGFQACNFIKKTPIKVFSRESVLRTALFIEHLWWLLLLIRHWITARSYVIQSRFKSRLFGLHVFVAFFRK